MLNPSEQSYKDAETLENLYHEKGLTLMEIGEEFGVNHVTILQWMERHGISRRSAGGPNRKTLPTGEIVERYESGETLRELGAEYGVDPATIAKRLEEQEVERRPSGPNTYETDAGELVRSSHERKVANWLYHNDFDYEYEPNLAQTRFIPDFLVRGRIIEVWGLMNREDYQTRRQEKLQAYRDLALYVVELYPEDMNELSTKLARELK